MSKLKIGKKISRKFFAVANGCLLSLLAFLMTACTKEEVKDPCKMGPPYMDIKIFDKDSSNLLDPNNEKGYKTDEIGFYKDSSLTINCITKEEQILFSDENAVYYLILPVNIDYHIERKGETFYCSTSYLKLNNTTIDTIYTECSMTECGEVLSKVVYNGEDITLSRIFIRKKD
jgi:hypothetical protein